jgi:Trypsin
MKGGLEINPTATYGGNPWCTAGYVVRDTNGYYKILTAGHCIQYHGGYDQPWYHHADGYGHGRYETFGIGVSRTADVGLTTIADSEIPTIKNQIYTGNGNVRNITGTRNLWEYPEGAPVQRYGTNSGWDSGTIVIRGVSRPSCVDGYGCMTVTQSVEVSFDSKGGDSGGPVYAVAPSGGINRIALGTHVHSDPDTETDAHGWYSPQDVGRALYDAITSGAPYEICSGILSPCP